MLGSGWKVERLLPRDDPLRFVIARYAVEVHAGDRHERQVVADAAGVIQEVTNGDGLAIGRQFRNELPDVVVSRQLSLLLEQQDTGGAELLRRRADVEHASRCE